MTNGEPGRPYDEPEPTFAERVMDRLKAFDERLRDVEGRTKDLEDDQAAFGLMDQLAAMDKRIDRLRDATQHNVRFLCAETISIFQSDVLGWLRTDAPNDSAAREYVLRAAATCSARVWNSETPTTIVSEFRSGLITYCKNHSLNAFLDDS